MKLIDPQCFVLRLNPGKSYALSNSLGACKFSTPASMRGIPKIYTVSVSDMLIYVGVASQPMSARLNFGFKADGTGGYHGYKWKQLTQELELCVWTALVGGNPATFRDLETVEAEVAFLCRQRSGQWPLNINMKYISISLTSVTVLPQKRFILTRPLQKRVRSMSRTTCWL